MNRQVWADCPDQPHETQILHEHGIDACRCDLAHEGFDGSQLARKDERVQRDVAGQAAAVMSSL